MIDWYRAKNRHIVRGVLQEIQIDKRTVSDAEVLSAIKLGNREDEQDQIRDLMAARYATTIVKKSGPSDALDPEGWFDVITRADVNTAIRNNIFEVVPTGFCASICSAIATLFTSDNQEWQWVNPDGTENSQVTELIKHIRLRGNFDEKIRGADHVASNVESCFLHMYFQGMELHYDVVYPCDIYFIPTDSVTEYVDGEPIRRAPNYAQIEDYSAVILRTVGGSDYDIRPEEEIYTAYLGASSENPLGRRVVYRAKSWTDRPPDVGDESVIEEYTHDGVPCNPLSRLVHSEGYGELEYPIVRLRGGHMAVSKDVRPVTTGLAKEAREIGVAWSKGLKETMHGMSGTDVFKMEVGMPLPDSKDAMVMYGNSDFERHPFPASMSHIEMIQATVKATAQGRNVPGWSIIGQMSYNDRPESGISLAIQGASLEKMREKRIKINQNPVNNIFEIEKLLLVEVHGEKMAKLFGDVRQKWDPGTLQVPKDEATRLADIDMMYKMGAIDEAEMLRRVHKLDTIEEAITYRDEMRERSDAGIKSDGDERGADSTGTSQDGFKTPQEDRGVNEQPAAGS